VNACPASSPAQAYISKIAEGEFKEAFEILTSSTPLMSICSVVCSHPCEDACTRGQKDDSVRIRDLKRFLIEKARREGWKAAAAGAAANGKRVAIVGAGPSGLAAAALLAGAGYAVTVFESSTRAGGMLRCALPAFRLPDEILDDDVELIESLGVTLEFNRTLGDNLDLEDLRKEYDAVYVAVGAQQSVSLGIAGEESGGVIAAVDFLRSVATGEQRSLGGRVAVIGGGFTAIDAARTALRLGAREAYLLYRRTRDQMPATREEIDEAEEEGVRIMYLVAPREIRRVNGKLRSIVLQSQVLGPVDESGRRRPEPVPGAEFELAADTVITALGQKAAVDKVSGLRLTSRGTIAVDAAGFTGLGGVYAGGDATSGASTVVDAIAAAQKAAARIDQDLMGERATLKTPAEKPRVDVDSVLVRHGRESRRWRTPLATPSPENRVKTFKPFRPVLSDEEAVLEAARCYRCGCGEGCLICHDLCKMFAYHKEGTEVVLDEEKCVGCGMCAWRCPNQNIEMVRTC
jgi:formate dehydrogenase major subunit